MTYVEIRDGARLVARVGYEAEKRVLRIKDVAGGRRKLRVWSPEAKDFRVAEMNESENVVDIKFES